MRKAIKRSLALALCVFMPLLCLAQNRVTLSGYIMDAKTGETLIGAGVMDRSIGCVSNSYGFYTLTLPKGEYTITCSYVGYAPQSLSVNLQRDTTVNFHLSPDTQISEATVVASREVGIEATKMSAIEVPLTLLQKVPVLLGEKDVIKTLQLLPGVQSGTEGFSGIYVRGGGPEENLLLLDGIPMYNAEHMLGILSVFQPEAVKKVTLHKGAFPARYGGRISSIIDIRTNDGNMKETHGSVSIGALTDKIHLEGPIIKDKLAYSFSGRVLHTFLFTPILKHYKIPANYYFYDLNGKLSWRISDKDRIYANIYSGRDKFYYKSDSNGSGTIYYEDDTHGSYTYTDEQNYGLKWGNTVVGARWNHVFSNRLFSNATLAYTRYSMLAYLDYSSETIETTGRSSLESFNLRYTSGMQDITAKIDFDYTPSGEHLIKFGAEYVHHTFIPETFAGYIYDDSDPEEKIEENISFNTDARLKGHEVAIYGEDDFKLWNRLTLNPGLRMALFYTNGTPYFSLEPRLSAKFDIDSDVALKASYSRMAQYVHLLSPSALSLPIDLWVPITENIKPVTADQIAAGVYYTGLKGWEFSLEGYYKLMNNVLEYKDGVGFFGNSSNWQNCVAMGKGEAYGAELFVQKTQGKTTGWLGYTLAWSNRIFPNGEINGGRKYPYHYDRRHNVDLVVNHQFNERWSISGSWTFASGGAITVSERQTIMVNPTNPDGEVYDTINKVGYVSSRNNYRLPPSHHLNIGVNYLRQKRKGTAEWNLSIYNVYNRMNPNLVFSGFYEEIENGMNSDGSWWHRPTGRYVMDKLTILPIIPSISWTRTF